METDIIHKMRKNIEKKIALNSRIVVRPNLFQFWRIQDRSSVWLHEGIEYAETYVQKVWVLKDFLIWFSDAFQYKTGNILM